MKGGGDWSQVPNKYRPKGETERREEGRRGRTQQGKRSKRMGGKKKAPKGKLTTNYE